MANRLSKIVTRTGDDGSTGLSSGERITKVEAERREALRLARGRRGGDDCVYIFELNARYDLDGRTRRNVAQQPGKVALNGALAALQAAREGGTKRRPSGPLRDNNGDEQQGHKLAHQVRQKGHGARLGPHGLRNERASERVPAETRSRSRRDGAKPQPHERAPDQRAHNNGAWDAQQSAARLAQARPQIARAEVDADPALHREREGARPGDARHGRGRGRRAPW